MSTEKRVQRSSRVKGEGLERSLLKNIGPVEHTRHRSIWNFTANILAALSAYALQPKKPSLNLQKHLALT